MNRTVSYVTLIVYCAVAICVAATQPHWASDANPFLHNFVNHEFLNLLGVILAITLASVINIHFEFNKIEERFQKEGVLEKSRANLRKNATFLIALFLFGVALVTMKPLIATHAVAQALVNMGALFILLWQVLLLVSLNQLAFAILPIVRPPAAIGDEPPPPQPPAKPATRTRRKSPPG